MLIQVIAFDPLQLADLALCIGGGCVFFFLKMRGDEYVQVL